MSYPANIVIVEDGRYRVIYNRGGGYPGSEACLFLGSSSDFTLDEFDDPAGERWNYAADAFYLVDHDQRRLLFQAGYFYDFADGHAYRTLLLQLVQQLWQGWRVDWAYEGAWDLVRHLGADPSVLDPWHGTPPPPRVRGRRGKRPRRSLERPSRRYSDSRYYCLVTVDDGDAVRAYGVQPWRDELLGFGPSLLDMLPDDAALTGCETVPAAGMHIDVPARTGGYWTDLSIGKHLHDVPRTWPGWRWRFWEDDYRAQRARAGDAVTIPDPDMDAAMTDFVTVWARRADWDADLALALLDDVLARPADDRIAAFADLVRLFQP